MCVLVGCGHRHPSRAYQRFVLVGNAGGELGKAGAWDVYRLPPYSALALDTKTGMLCVTYEFKIDVDHPEWKDRNIPTCKSLYDKDPD
jgi:hypothetical protein